MISAQDRRNVIELITEAVANGARTVSACRFLGIAFSTYRKWVENPDDEDRRPHMKRPTNANALSESERKAVCDLSIRQAFYKRLDEGEYLASESTVYRIMRTEGANKRRDGTKTPIRRYKPTSYVATGPNQVWSWDITYLRDANHPTRFFYAFAAIDIYSRYVVHADVFEAENADNAVEFLSEAMDKHHIRPRALVLHSDNGAAMKAAPALALLERRQVQFSHSRPRVSDDNPYSEAMFKTMKYAGYMGKKKYGSLEDAKQTLQEFVTAYNEKWAHSGINNVTPLCRFNGADAMVQARRNLVMQEAQARNPNRWIQGKRKHHAPAGEQYLNPDKPAAVAESSPEPHLLEGTRNSGEQSVHWGVAA